ncbi:WD40/YVTN/BNR-like repeat-containing protein [Microbulbifer magnicolonia]|uniref:WD40/YVTN/BNR-like repeat-containing protein n=1 Tax=Microbulbifer magnicolonia TaxID=3109744 RepID=UPI002B4157C1|nr:YCF48-related protein [Microbulbifer sp. GG15]
MSVTRFLLPAILAALPCLASAKVELLDTPALPSASADTALMMALSPHNGGYLVSGERGLLLQWQPSGEWQQLQTPVSVALTGLATLADGRAFAVGHDAAILRRAADGRWQKIFDGYDLTRMQIAALESRRDALQQALDNPPADADIGELEFQLEETGINIEDAQAEMQSGPNKPLLAIAGSGSNLFAVGAYGSFLKSADGGDSWQLQSGKLDNPDRFHLNAVTATGDGSLYIVGESGTGFVSRDGGDSWARMDLPYGGSLFGVAAQPHSRNLVAYGLQGNLLISRDGGETWTHHHIDAGASLLGGTVTDSGEVYLVGHGGLVVSFPIDDPGALAVRKHPSGAALSAVAADGDKLILAGQFGITVWDQRAWNKKEVSGDAE